MRLQQQSHCQRQRAIQPRSRRVVSAEDKGCGQAAGSEELKSSACGEDNEVAKQGGVEEPSPREYAIVQRSIRQYVAGKPKK